MHNIWFLNDLGRLGITNDVMFQANIYDKLKIYDLISASQRWETHTIKYFCHFCISSVCLFHPQQIFLFYPHLTEEGFCDIHRFTQTGTCVFCVAAHSSCSHSLTLCLLGGIHITFIQYFCCLANAHNHRDVQQTKIKLWNLLQQ